MFSLSLIFKAQSWEEGLIKLILEVLDPFRKSASMRTAHLWYLPQFQYSTLFIGMSRSAFILAECPNFISWAISKAASAAAKNKGIICQILFKNWKFRLQENVVRSCNYFGAFCICKNFIPFLKWVTLLLNSSYSTSVVAILILSIYTRIHMCGCN